MSVPLTRTKDGFESQMAVNYLGHFLLSHLLIPQLQAGAKELQKSSRIVNISSCAHYAGEIDYNNFNCHEYYYEGRAYCNSKLAQVMFSRHLNEICNENNWNVEVFSCHPGVVNTGIFENSLIGSLNFLRKIIMKVS
jgi:NAD(P)-dependent dehydrogenase (short-subunit alcohol dehydrogenase family)